MYAATEVICRYLITSYAYAAILITLYIKSWQDNCQAVSTCHDKIRLTTLIWPLGHVRLMSKYALIITGTSYSSAVSDSYCTGPFFQISFSHCRTRDSALLSMITSCLAKELLQHDTEAFVQQRVNIPRNGTRQSLYAAIRQLEWGVFPVVTGLQVAQPGWNDTETPVISPKSR